jgi:hypothetical protein
VTSQIQQQEEDQEHCRQQLAQRPQGQQVAAAIKTIGSPEAASLYVVWALWLVVCFVRAPDARSLVV